MDRPARHNAINGQMLREINDALDMADADPSVRSVLLEGNASVFCTGLDLEGDAGDRASGDIERGVRDYLALLKRFCSTAKLIFCQVEGRCEAGGVGFVAAADFAIAGPRASFRLSEALLGLLPATLMPFLIRRVGFRQAYRMTLACPTLGPREALAAGLVDAADDEAGASLRSMLLSCERVSERTVGAAKAYFNALAPITPEVEDLAVGRITSLLAEPDVAARIRDLMAQGMWQRRQGEH
jgi:polyketide biosynthesis enoyl-CoA hydratase PksH